MIGEYLTKVRIEAGVSIEDMSKRTRIRRSYLIALEKDDFSNIPGETYIKGHIQTYLKALGVDPSDGLKIYHEQLKQTSDVGTSVTQNTEFNPVKGNSVKPAKSYKYILAAIILFAAAAIFFIFNKNIQTPGLKIDFFSRISTNIRQFLDTVNSSQTDNTSLPAQPAAAQSDNGTTALLAQTTVTEPSPSPQPAAVTADVASGTKQHTLTLKASDLTWLSVKIDGKESKQMFLKPMETVQWVADDNFILKLGNAGGVKIVFDGKELEGYGQKGSVITLQLPPKPIPSETPSTE
ncbi:MAG: helix-turn-helix domain-containing protein [Nitrospirae bacterium YQR-1]